MRFDSENSSRLKNQTECPICGNGTEVGLAVWHRQCHECGLEISTLEVAINRPAHQARIDEHARADALRTLRMANFEKIRDIIQLLRPAQRLALLDVGAAHGWFVEMMARDGVSAVGIEPDEAVPMVPLPPNAEVRRGFFPDAVRDGERFDVISFNDVFEHLPHPRQALAACLGLLNERGLVVLNLPDSRGTVYRLTRAAYRLGLRRPFERMWQVGLPSPHLQYFATPNLRVLADRAGFEVRHAGTLASVTSNGLWRRIRFESDRSALSAAPMWLAAMSLVPVLRWLPADISLVVLEKRDGAHVHS